MWGHLFATLVIALGVANAKFPVPRNVISNVRAEDSSYYRLPTNIKPVSYNIHLTPDLEAATFDGYVEIEIEVLEATDSITLHIDQITITQALVKAESINTVENLLSKKSTTNDDRQFLILNLTEAIVPGTPYVIILTYEGILHGDNDGFYLGKYIDEDGNVKLLATTQFEATSARRAFPCFDEPSFKAKFSINIKRSSSYNTVSNMKLNNSLIQDDGKVLDIFAETVKMPTYLIAFIVSDFEHAKKGRQGVLASKANIAAGNQNYALDAGEAILAALEVYTGIPFAIGKMDQAAIPNNYFAAGAMENWGLVTYRERYLMYLEGTSTAMEKQQVATIIAHEFAHQWFGDLVSPLWWKYIWLNEGFATYFEYFATALVETDWRLEEQFLVDVVQNALAVDCFNSTRPMSTDAGSPAEISSLFDNIAYDKSGSVINMWNHILTPDVFKAGLKNHLLAKQNDVAQATDLYAGLQAAVDAAEDGTVLLPPATDVKALCENWEKQAGYPLVTVDVDIPNKVIKLSQKRYLADNDDGTDKTLWHIPINFVVSTNLDFSSTETAIWLSEAELPIIFPDFKDTDFIILNKKATGFYRIKYDEYNWALITDYLLTKANINKIDPLNRAQLIDDAFTLAKYGHLDYSIPLELSKYLVEETDYIPITAYLNSISSLNRLLAGSANFKTYTSYVSRLLQTTYAEQGLDEATADTHINKRLRANILNVLCKFSNECKAGALSRLQAWMADAGATIAPNLESAMYCGALASGGAEEWDFLFETYQNATLDTKRGRLLTSLGCTENTGRLSDFMNASVNAEASINSADRVGVFTAVISGSNTGLDTAFDFVINNFKRIQDAEGLGNSALRSILSNIGSRCTTNAQLQKMNALKEANPEADVFTAALANINVNIEWVDVYQEKIVTWVDTYMASTNFGTANTLSMFSLIAVFVTCMYQHLL